MAKVVVPTIHPGEILREEYLIPLRLSPYAVAKAIGVPRTRIERLAAEKSSVTTDTAIRLGKFFDTTPNFWLNMQASYDLAMASVNTGDIPVFSAEFASNELTEKNTVTRRAAGSGRQG
jgi:antitoxin HigA-1